MINETLQTIIQRIISGRADKHGWDSGLFADIIKLSADQRGEIGEALLHELLVAAGVEGVIRTATTDRTQKHWDIRTADMDIEVKTATLGRNNNRFQHESIERDRNYHAIVMIDIAPSAVYITWTAKRDIPFRQIHRRANSNFYKWDFNLSDVLDNEVKTIADISARYQQTAARICQK